METRQISGFQGLEIQGGVDYRGPGRNLESEGTVLYLVCGGGYMTYVHLSNYTLNRVHFTVCKLYLKK